MKARLHCRAEGGMVSIHPPYDFGAIEELVVRWREANEMGGPNAASYVEQEIADYLALRLTVEDADDLCRELRDAIAPF